MIVVPVRMTMIWAWKPTTTTTTRTTTIIMIIITVMMMMAMMKIYLLKSLNTAAKPLNKIIER